MNHLALYRQFRPRTFDEMVGQSHITTTLKNQIKTGKLGHAYLFCGSRGTGKTTAAKVFAKAVNCQHTKDGNPCLECSFCLDQTHVDIIELDAASNNGVDYIRDIKEKASFSPINGKYKVYIVDEVHMLSVNAFNAFLKILEEPPSYAIFVLCTTEPQKIPQTILSRCMRFDFRLVGLNHLTNLLTDILKKVGKKVTLQAINAICLAGDGSVRDTLSIADRCLAFCEDKVLDYEDVMNILGATDNSSVETLASAILSGNIADILTTTQGLIDAGKNVIALARDLTTVFRNILVCKTVPTAQQLLALPNERYDRLKRESDEYTIKKVTYALNTFAKTESDLRYALNPKVFIETMALKVATSTGEVDVDGLEARIYRLEKKIEELCNNPPVQNIAVNNIATANNATTTQQTENKPNTSTEVTNVEKDFNTTLTQTTNKPKSDHSSMEVWGKIMAVLRADKDDFLLTIC
ncbi:MAG: DNA polymerase III subunit gamma/tau, partial [Clostridia bacterium]|nr:DNA polymerase III subunit gamma/tau [Clostridia bacterium]